MTKWTSLSSENNLISEMFKVSLKLEEQWKFFFFFWNYKENKLIDRITTNNELASSYLMCY